MDKFNFSGKHVAINKANAQIVAVVGIASFITIFCLVASKAVLSQYQYQGRVIKVANTADTQLKENISAYKSLVQSYAKFDSASPNVIGQPVTGSSNDNAQVILDALPGEYDFPGLTSTLENILVGAGMQVTGITGSDAAYNSSGTTASTVPPSTSSSPTPYPMPFGFSVQDASYGSVQQLIQIFQQSIRPMAIDTISLSAQQSNLTMTVAAHTYYQPQKTLSITEQAVH